MYANGKIPTATLRRSTIGVLLTASAAASADRLAKEFEKKAEIPLRGTDGYREGVDQERIFRERYQTAYIQYAPGRVDRREWNGKYYYRKPGFAAAAVPGTSNHGLGTAVDFASGINQGFTSRNHLLFAPIAKRHGWTITEGRAVNEPWHWVHDASRDRYPWRKVKVTKVLDKATIYAIQRALGRPVTAASTEAGQVSLWKAVQKRLNKRGAKLVIDGDPGPLTWGALQNDLRKINRNPLNRPRVTREGDAQTIRAWQKALNAKKW